MRRETEDAIDNTLVKGQDDTLPNTARESRSIKLMKDGSFSSEFKCILYSSYQLQINSG